ncbi:unnamed protein product, partial [Closterium sp. Naga37s-1]
MTALEEKTANRRILSAYETLSREGFTVEQVENALLSLVPSSLSLEAAFDWLCLHLAPQQLPRHFASAAATATLARGDVEVVLAAADVEGEGQRGGDDAWGGDGDEDGGRGGRSLAEEAERFRKMEEERKAKEEAEEKEREKERKKKQADWIKRYVTEYESEEEESEGEGKEQEGEDGEEEDDWEKVADKGASAGSTAGNDLLKGSPLWEVWADARERRRRKELRKKAPAEPRLQSLAADLGRAKGEAARAKGCMDKGRQAEAGLLIRELKEEAAGYGCKGRQAEAGLVIREIKEEAAAYGYSESMLEEANQQQQRVAAEEDEENAEEEEEAFGLFGEEEEEEEAPLERGGKAASGEGAGAAGKPAEKEAEEEDMGLEGMSLFDDESDGGGGGEGGRGAAAALPESVLALQRKSAREKAWQQQQQQQMLAGGRGNAKAGGKDKKGKDAAAADMQRQPKALLQQHCLKALWPAPKYTKLPGSSGAGKFSYSVTVVRQGGRGGGGKGGGAGGGKGGGVGVGPITFQVSAAEDGFESVSEAQNAVELLALHALLPHMPLHHQLVSPYREQWLELAEKADAAETSSSSAAAAAEAAARHQVKFAAALVDKEIRARETAAAAAAAAAAAGTAAGVAGGSSAADDVEESAPRDEGPTVVRRREAQSRELQQRWRQWQALAVGGARGAGGAGGTGGTNREAMETSERRAMQEMKRKRGELPMAAVREEVVQALREGDVVVVSGETGSGKTTQVPQYIFEEAEASGKAGFCNIVCTQPRRIAAISVAERVAAERCEPPAGSGSRGGGPAGVVGYHVRLDAVKTWYTRITFCTTGILLRRLVGDPLLSDVTHVVVDEVHEHSIQGDFLLVILRDLLARRQHMRRQMPHLPALKLVLMSATLDASLFASYFSGCPVIQAQGRTFPVEMKYLEDVYESTGYKLSSDSPAALRSDSHQSRAKGSKAAAGGGSKTKQKLLKAGWGDDASLQAETVNPDYDASRYSDYSDSTRKNLRRVDEGTIDYELLEDVVAHIDTTCGPGAILVFLPVRCPEHLPCPGAILFLSPQSVDSTCGPGAILFLSPQSVDSTCGPGAILVFLPVRCPEHLPCPGAILFLSPQSVDSTCGPGAILFLSPQSVDSTCGPGAILVFLPVRCPEHLPCPGAILFLSPQSVDSTCGPGAILFLSPQSVDSTCGPGAVLVFLPGMGEIQYLWDRLAASRQFGAPGRVEWLLPLHSSVSAAEQRQAFNSPPSGVRKVVLATNIAETSITIDDVVYVVDVGKQKETQFDARRGMTSLVEAWVAKANVRQRAGRAGRVQAGRYFALFTRHRFETIMRPFQQPEIQRVPLVELCLQIKLLDLGTPAQFLSKAIEPPKEEAVRSAMKTLREVGAVDEREELTALGTHLAALPVDVRIGKMMIYGAVMGCLSTALTIAACLSYRSPFSSSFHDRKAAARARQALVAKAREANPDASSQDAAGGRQGEKGSWDDGDSEDEEENEGGWESKVETETAWGKGEGGAGASGDDTAWNMARGQQSDHLAMASAFNGWVLALQRGSRAAREFCQKHHLSIPALLMLRDMRVQFARLLMDIGFLRQPSKAPGSGGAPVSRGFDWLDESTQPWNRCSMSAPAVKAVLCAGLYPNVAMMARDSIEAAHCSHASDLAHVAGALGRPRWVTATGAEVAIHPSSVNEAVSVFRAPFLVFHEKVKTSRVYIRDCTVVSPAASFFLADQSQSTIREHECQWMVGWTLLLRLRRLYFLSLSEGHLTLSFADISFSR